MYSLKNKLESSAHYHLIGCYLKCNYYRIDMTTIENMYEISFHSLFNLITYHKYHLRLDFVTVIQKN